MNAISRGLKLSGKSVYGCDRIINISMDRQTSHRHYKLYYHDINISLNFVFLSAIGRSKLIMIVLSVHALPENC